jgi:hypothetical protein
MARVILQHIGEKDGMPCYTPVDKEDADAVGGRMWLECDIKADKTLVTSLQMRSIHLYFKLLSEALNAAGLDMKAVMDRLSKNAMIPWSASAIKERLWRPVIINTYDKESTTKLETSEISGGYEALNQVTSEQLGISIPFPDRYNQMNEQLGIK